MLVAVSFRLVLLKGSDRIRLIRISVLVCVCLCVIQPCSYPYVEANPPSKLIWSRRSASNAGWTEPTGGMPAGKKPNPRRSQPRPSVLCHSLKTVYAANVLLQCVCENKSVSLLGFCWSQLFPATSVLTEKHKKIAMVLVLLPRYMNMLIIQYHGFPRVPTVIGIAVYFTHDPSQDSDSRQTPLRCWHWCHIPWQQVALACDLVSAQNSYSAGSKTDILHNVFVYDCSVSEKLRKISCSQETLLCFILQCYFSIIETLL